MSPLEVVCALWRRPGEAPEDAKKRYGVEHVWGLREMLGARCPGARLTCVTNVPGVHEVADDVVLLPDRVAALPSQYPKLWLQSDEFARAVGIGRRFLFSDLDVVVMGDWSALAQDADGPVFRANYPDLRAPGVPGATWRVALAPPSMPRASPPFSTSLYMFASGQMPHVWRRFSLWRARRIRGWTGSDQRWMNWVLGPRVATWRPDERFDDIGRLLRTGERPATGCLVVTCGHVDPPWSPTIRERLPWLVDAYPLMPLIPEGVRPDRGGL